MTEERIELAREALMNAIDSALKEKNTKSTQFFNADHAATRALFHRHFEIGKFEFVEKEELDATHVPVEAITNERGSAQWVKCPFWPIRHSTKPTLY